MKIKQLLQILTVFCVTVAQGQTADEIINKYFENTGGRAKYEAVQGIKMNAKMNQGGMEIPIAMYQLKDGRTMQVVTFQGKEIKQGVFDGSTLWSHNFMNMKAEKSDTESTENFKVNIGGDFPLPFFDYKKRGYKVELVGKETIDGTETFKIKLTKNPIKVDGKPKESVEFYFFDTENFIPLMVESEVTQGQGKGMIQQVKLSDYQEVPNSNGLIMPFSITQGAKGKPGGQPISFTSIELNPKVEASIFAMPAEN